jgi:hypothetical protein
VVGNLDFFKEIAILAHPAIQPSTSWMGAHPPIQDVDGWMGSFFKESAYLPIHVLDGWMGAHPELDGWMAR